MSRYLRQSCRVEDHLRLANLLLTLDQLVQLSEPLLLLSYSHGDQILYSRQLPLQFLLLL